MPPKRPVSAYFVFCNQHRAATKAEHLAETGAEKVSVAAVAKLLGAKWKALTDEEREAYKKRAAEQSAEDKQQEQEAQPMEGTEATEGPEGKENEVEGEGKKEEFQHPFGLPLSLVKRVMQMDEDVKSISSDALKATAKATELVIHMLAAKAYKVAALNKRRTIKFTDVQQALNKDPRWENSGIRELLRDDEMFDEARSQIPGGGGRPKAAEVDPAARQITSFFKA